MNRVLLLAIICFACTIKASSQSNPLCGTWKYHREANMGGGEHYSWDYYIRIDIEENNVFVRLKQVTNIDGKEFQDRTEGEHVMVNTDGSISFDDFLSKNEYHQDDCLYWTVWQHFVVKYEGGRLKVTRKLMGEGRNKDGVLIKDDKNHLIEHMTYYNEKDNW